MSRMKPPERAPAERPVERKPGASVTRVLFVCVGNAIRSQMAEAFARRYGADVLVPLSAGVVPAPAIQPLTRSLMLKRGIDIGDAYPKTIEEALKAAPVDLIINMSGMPFGAKSPAPVREWLVPDPIGAKESVYEQTAQKIEGLIMQLILELRQQAGGAKRA